MNYELCINKTPNQTVNLVRGGYGGGEEMLDPFFILYAVIFIYTKLWMCTFNNYFLCLKLYPRPSLKA